MGKTSQQFGERIKQHVPKHLMDSAKEPATKRRGRSPKKRDNPAGEYQSAIACHLAANKDCCISYSEILGCCLVDRSIIWTFLRLCIFIFWSLCCANRSHMSLVSPCLSTRTPHLLCIRASSPSTHTNFMHSHIRP